jgi:hypothetical protein
MIMAVETSDQLVGHDKRKAPNQSRTPVVRTVLRSGAQRVNRQELLSFITLAFVEPMHTNLLEA